MNQSQLEATKSDLELCRQIRRKMVALVRGVSPAQALAIPSGFNNSILWNAGHCLVTQQILCYKLSGLPMTVSDELSSLLRKGTSPKEWGAPPDAEAILAQLEPMVDAAIADLDAGKFQTYTPYQTSFGVHLGSVADAIRFNNAHEALHLGYMMALRRAVA